MVNVPTPSLISVQLLHQLCKWRNQWKGSYFEYGALRLSCFWRQDKGGGSARFAPEFWRIEEKKKEKMQCSCNLWNPIKWQSYFPEIAFDTGACFYWLIGRTMNAFLGFSTTALSSVQFSRSVVSDSLPPHELQHARPPCPLPTPRVLSDSRPSNQWCHAAISSSVVPFSSCPQSLPASESFPMSQLFTRWPKYWTFSFSIIPSKELKTCMWKRSLKFLSLLIQWCKESQWLFPRFSC